jgi:hypothetical protein
MRIKQRIKPTSEEKTSSGRSPSDLSNNLPRSFQELADSMDPGCQAITSSLSRLISIAATIGTVPEREPEKWKGEEDGLVNSGSRTASEIKHCSRAGRSSSPPDPI